MGQFAPRRPDYSPTPITGDHMVLSVEDGGPGFDLRETGRRSSGLGLVRGLAQQLRGTFRVERTPGARCTVTFVESRTS